METAVERACQSASDSILRFLTKSESQRANFSQNDVYWPIRSHVRFFCRSPDSDSILNFLLKRSCFAFVRSQSSTSDQANLRRLMSSTEEETAKKKEAVDKELGLPCKETEEFSATDLQLGLTSQQVAASREKWGINEIPAPVTPLYVIFRRQFTGFLQVLIEIAAIITLVLKDWTDFVIIVGILIVNALLGFREEYKDKKALDDLSKSLESEIAVRRDGETKNVPKELVPGDICLLVGGNIVPADTKWIKGDIMSVNTAA